jgi:hypothetical protein
MLALGRLARIAGGLYLLLIIAAAFAVAVRSSIIVPGDATATADNIRASASLFRLAFAVDLTANLIFLLTAMALYLLLRNVQQLVAVVMVAFVAIGVAVASLNLLHHYTALIVATDESYTRSLGAQGADAMVLLLTGMFADGNILNHLWFGPWLLPLAWLVIHSGSFPRLLGVLQVAACLGYMGWLYVSFLAPDAPAAINSTLLAVAAIGEGAFVVWLAVVGPRPMRGGSPRAVLGRVGP